MNNFFALQSELEPGSGFALWGREHLIALLCCAVLGGGLCILSRRAGQRGRTRLRRGLGTAVLLCEAAKDLNLLAHGSLNRYFLPLHLCSLAVFLTAWHSRYPGKTLGNFLYSTCMPGAACALLFPDWTAWPLWSFHALLGFLAHALLTVYPLTQLTASAFRPDVTQLPRCFGFLLLLALPVWFFDHAFSVNYMFLLRPSPGSPLEWFAAWLGNPGYLLGYLPMLGLIWTALYLPFSRPKKEPAA